MPIRTIQDLRRQAGGQWQDKTDEDLISAYADFVQADPVEIANTLGYKPSESGVTGQRFGAAFDRYQAGLYGLGEAVTGGLGFTGAQESLAERRRANEFEATVASRAARELGGIESYKDVRGIGTGLSYIGGLAIGSSPYIAEAAVGGLAARGLMGGTRAALGTAAQAGDVAASQAARRTLNRGMLAGGAVTSYPSSVGEILQAQREQTGTADLGTAAALGVPFAALNVIGVEGAAARLGAFRSMGEGLDALKGFRGGLTRAGVTGLRVGATESLSETGQEGLSQVGRMAVDPSEEFLSPEARERFTESAIGGFALGKTFGTLGGGWRRSVEPLDLTKDAQGALNQGIDTSRINVQPGAGLSTQDLINQITGVTRPEGERPTRQSMEAALNEPTGRMVAGPGGIERPQTAGETFGIPPAPPSPAQPTPQQAQGAQPPQAQTPQIDPAIIQQTAQAYGVSQVPQAPGVPTQAFNIAGKTVFGVNNANNIVSQIAQTNQTKDPDRVRLETAVVASGIPIGGQPTAKGILGGIDSIIKKYQLDGAATLNDAANILEFQIGQAKSAKTAEPMARIYEALTGQMSPAFQRLSEGPTTTAAPTATPTPAAGTTGLELMTGQPAPTVPRDYAEQVFAQYNALTDQQREQVATQLGLTRAQLIESEAIFNRTEEVDDAIAAVKRTGAPSGLQPTARTGQGPQAAVGGTTGITTTGTPTTGAGAPAPTTGTPQAGRTSPTVTRPEEDVDVASRLFDGIAQRFNIDLRFADLDPSLQEAWFNAVEANAANREVVTALANEQTLDNNSKLADQILRIAINRMYPADKQKVKREFVLEMYGTTQANRDETVAQLAKRFDRTVDTIKKDWNRTVKALMGTDRQKFENGIKAAMVELRLSDEQSTEYLNNLIETLRTQQDQAQITEAEVEELTIDQRELGAEDASIIAKGRTSDSIQEKNNAVETNNQAYARVAKALDAIEVGDKPTSKQLSAANKAYEDAGNDLTQVKNPDHLAALAIDAELNDDQFFKDQIVTELNNRLENRVETAKKLSEANVARRDGEPTQEGEDAVQKRETKETKTKYQVTYEGKPATLTIVRSVEEPNQVAAVNIKVDGEGFAVVNLGKQGVITDENLINSMVETEILDSKGEPSAVQKRETKKVSVQPKARGGEEVGQEVRGDEKPAREGETQAQEKEVKTTAVATTPQIQGAKVTLLPPVEGFEKQATEAFGVKGFGAYAMLFHNTDKNQNIWSVPRFRADKPGEGSGSKLMDAVTVWADKTGATLTITAAADTQSGKKLSQEELVKFYEKRGFEPDEQSKERIAAGVSYQTLIRYPAQVTTQTTKAPSTQTTQAAVVLTKQEAAEAKYNELRQLVGDALPTWDKLSDAQRAALVEIDPAQMNMRDLQRIVDDSRTIDVEAREVSGTERQLLLEQTNKLNDSQVKLLENEYGAKVGTDSFVKQLSTDVSNYVNKGAEFVSAKIRAVIKAIASGVLAIGVVFNPNVQLNNFSFDLPSTYASSKTVITEVPADAAPRMSALAQSVYVQMANAAQKSGKGFIIADKPNGMIHLFNADGSLLAQDTALYGKDVGDSIAGQKASLEGGPKVTPAGQFELGIMPSNDYVGGFGLTLQGTDQPLTSPENLSKKRFNSTVAVHAAYLGDVNERRLDRLASKSAKDNRISYGCINTSHDLFINKIKPNAKSFDGGMIFVLPDNPQFLAEKGQLPTPPAPKTPAKNAMRRRAEKHVQELTNTDQSLMLEDASLDEMTEAYEGVSWLRSRYESLGLSNVFNAVGQFFVSYNTNVDWDGIITNIDNQVSVVLRQDIAAQKGASLWTMGHELGHAVDRVIQGDDVYSSDQRLNLRKTKDRVIPMGEVAVEMANLRKKNDAINTVLGYPYDFNEVSDLTTQKVRQELFAQIWALYTTNDVTRDIIDQQAPKTSAFMKEVLADVQTTENFNATNLTGPAFDSREEGFPQRRDRPDESVGTAAQVAAAQQNVPVARSRNARAAANVLNNIPPTVRSSSNSIYQTIRNWTRKGVDRVVFTEALINRAVEAGIRSAAEFKQLMQARGVETRKFEKEVERIADMYALVPDKDRGTGSQSVNAFIYDSTRTKKWGFQPKWRSTGVAVDADLEIRFDALSSEAQSFIRAVFKHGDDTLAMKKKILMDYTNSEYDAQIKAAQADGNAQLIAELQKEKIADLKKFDTLFKLREGIPYAPLKRIGKYAVVAKSPEYRAAETADDKKRIRELEQDPNHYQVSFVDSDIQARNLQKQLQDQGFYGTNEDAVYYFEREKFQDELYGGDTMLAALSKLRATVERTGQDEKSTNQLRRIITDMYLHALADSSARKSELRRRAVPGEIDMLQSFALQGRADANFLAAVQYNNRTQEALQKMRKQAREGGNRTRKSELLNELNARYIQSLEYEPNQMVQKLNRLTSVYFLASSPGYYLQNFTQPWMMSLPVMAGRHDYTKSANALYNAYFDLKDVMKSAKLFDQQFDFSKVPDDIKDVVETLVNRSQIDIGISTEMGEFTIEGQGPVSNTYNKVDKGMRLAVQKVEAINRLTTAIAAYRLELAKTGNRDLAVDYASSIINDTHGDYSAFNAPRMFNTNIGKVALQFRKFQLIQLGLLAKLIKNSFTKGPEQQVAQKALTYILAQTAVLTGVMGMPGAAAIAWALEGLLGDEDEPFDIKGQIRDAIGDDDIANIILYGAPNLAGVNLSGKIGMGNALSVMPFTEIKDLNGEKTYQIIGTLLGGPAGGMTARMADGMSYIAAGDEYKGLELMLPKGLGDAMRSVRIYNEGFTSRRGDVLLPPDQIGEVTAFWQALGLTPTQTSVRGEQQGRTIDIEQKFSSRSSTLKRQYEQAAKDQDRTKQAELRRQWLDLQAARVRNGYPRRPMSELTTAPQEQRKRERQTSEGVPFTESSRRFVERITA